METSLIKQPETAEFEKKNSVILAQAEALQIVSVEAFEMAAELLNSVTQQIKNIEAQFKEPVDKAFQAHRAMTGLRDKVLGIPRTAKLTLSRKMGVYQAEKEQARREAAAKAMQEAQKRAEDERLKLAQAAEARGDDKAVESLLNAPLTPRIDPTAIPEAAPKVKGVITRTDWDFTITDLSKVPPEYLVADEVKIRKVVRALGAECSIPGIAVFQKTIVGSRGMA